MNDAVVVENKIVTNQIDANILYTDTLIAKDVAVDQLGENALKKDFLASICKSKNQRLSSVAEMEARIKQMKNVWTFKRIRSDR